MPGSTNTLPQPEDLLYWMLPLGGPLRADWDGDKVINWRIDADVPLHLVQAMTEALALIETFTSITFELKTESSVSVDFVLSITTDDVWGFGVPNTETGYENGFSGIVALNSERFAEGSGYNASLLKFAAMHELLHTLGARHIGDYDFNFDPWPNDASLSLTSYYFNNTPYDQVVTLPSNYSAIDILTLQAWYGLNSSIDTLNNVYTFNVTSGYQTIYDTGGTETIDVSSLSGKGFVDLRPGYVSKIDSKYVFGLAFSGDVVQAAMDRQGTVGNALALDTRIENAIGTLQNDDIIGNSANNVLYGYDGDDKLYGGLGSDILVGGKGNDAIIGNFQGVPEGAIASELAFYWHLNDVNDSPGDIDTADYSSSRLGNAGMTTGITVDMSLPTAQVTNDGFGYKDTLISIEKIIGSDRHDFIYVGGGLRVVDGGDGSDKVSFGYSGGAVQIDLNQTVQHGGSAEGVQLYNVEEADGSIYGDTIHLKDTGYTFSYANRGNDTIYGGHGTTVVYGDVVDNGQYVTANIGNDTFYHLGGQSTFYAGLWGDDVLNLSLAGTSGFDFNFTLNFKEGTARLHGNVSGPADITFTSVERFVGANGDDTYNFNNDVYNSTSEVNFNGGNGVDTMDFSAVTQGIQLYYVSGGTLKASSASKLFVSFEKFQGSDGGDRLTLLGNMTEVHGGSGNDTLDLTYWFGNVTHYWASNQYVFSNSLIVDGFENYVLRAGQANIVGTSAADVFNGSSDADRIWGQGGNDVFNWSNGADTLYGEGGDDTFYVSKGDYASGGADRDVAHVSQEAYGYSAADFAKFTGIEEFHFANEAGVSVTFAGEVETVYLAAYATSNVKFADSSKDREVYGGDKVDYFEFWGGGSVDGGGGNDQLDLRKMTGLVWDQTAQEFHWGDRVLSYSNIARFRYNDDTVIQNSGPSALGVAENQVEDGSMFAAIGISPGSSDYFWA